jgi:crotonobetainyl-CoA:carnitine CoA-transferase CaiB-like acyl-CoA transferase
MAAASSALASDVPRPFGALSDIRIIDLTQMLAGPYGTMVLADHGAEVIKIEGLDGDVTRSAGPYRDGDNVQALGGYFQSVDRNKRSVCLDLKTEEGKRIFKELVKTADAVTENFRAGVMDRLGLSYETLREINPRLVYGALRGFGDRRTGHSPYQDWPAYDVVAQAMGGVMAITGPDAAAPTKVGPGIGDIVPGIMLGFGGSLIVFDPKAPGYDKLFTDKDGRLDLRRAIPRVGLIRLRLVRADREAIGRVGRPRREQHRRRAETPLPGRKVRARRGRG